MFARKRNDTETIDVWARIAPYLPREPVPPPVERVAVPLPAA